MTAATLVLLALLACVDPLRSRLVILVSLLGALMIGAGIVLDLVAASA